MKSHFINNQFTPGHATREIAVRNPATEDVLDSVPLGTAQDITEAVLDYSEGEGLHVVATPLDVSLPDPDDKAFLEVAVAAGAEGLITGNARHFPVKLRHGVQVVGPREFIDPWPSHPE